MPSYLTSVCVFCGSAMGDDPRFGASARDTGRLLAETGAELVYGGSNVGLMGMVADGALAAGGHVVGYMPGALIAREIAHPNLSELHQVPDMAARKAAMGARATAFLALPGGIGTLEEAFEQWTLAQIGVHAKPLAFLNIAGYFDPMLAMIDQMVARGFLHDRYLASLIVADTPTEALARLAAFKPPAVKTYG